MDENQTTPSSNSAAETSTDTLDFESVYANNTLIENSLWDLKIIFGQLEQHTGRPQVDWHTAVTVPWLQSKILSYYLRLNILSHEADNGTIKVPGQVMPPKPLKPSGEFENDPKALEFFEMASKIYSENFD